jgi:hypothetical protein
MNRTGTPFTPAALKAAAAGDFDNFLVASTSGGIEAQEAAGQATLCASAQLPKEINGATREQLEAIGFKFGANVDELFVTAHLPPAWKKVAGDNAYWSWILDDKNRKRASIFYKAAFYDRRAHMRMERRFNVSLYDDAADKDWNRAAVKDGDNECAYFGVYKTGDYDTQKAKDAECRAWLAEHQPLWNDPLAYWA